MPIRTLRKFIKLETSGGIVLFAFAVLALILDNSPLSVGYEHILDFPFSIQIANIGLSKPVFSWINEGLMSIFFLLIGLEIKREVFEGDGHALSKVLLPAIAALSGMLVPAIVYIAINWGNQTALRGWAIPTATDIAFSLALLSFLGKRVPASLKVFLAALAIFDDLGAIIIIGIFYTEKFSMVSSILVALFSLGLLLLNRLSVSKLTPYIIIGLLLWLSLAESGLHATLAGIAVALAIPLRDKSNLSYSPLRHLEKILHPSVAFVILPVFALANAGVSFKGLTLNDVSTTVTIGIAAGLVIGKQTGIFGATWIAVKCGIVTMPHEANWRMIYGIALICGIGFTMSLFIGTLAFNEAGTLHAAMVRVGVLSGSCISGLLGYVLLRSVGRKEIG